MRVFRAVRCDSPETRYGPSQALQVSGASLSDPFGTEMAHPTVLDLVMNDVAEPDCSPQPFDILAVYARYQGVGAE